MITKTHIIIIQTIVKRKHLDSNSPYHGTLTYKSMIMTNEYKIHTNALKKYHILITNENTHKHNHTHIGWK